MVSGGFVSLQTKGVMVQKLEMVHNQRLLGRLCVCICAYICDMYVCVYIYKYIYMLP